MKTSSLGSMDVNHSFSGSIPLDTIGMGLIYESADRNMTAFDLNRLNNQKVDTDMQSRSALS